MDFLGPVYTMEHEVGPWKIAFFHGPTSIVQFLKQKLGEFFYIVNLGPSLGVNRMWTKQEE